MLTTSNLSVYPGRERKESPILEAIDFQARAGELIAIVGPSGCGKSTFLKAVAGLAHHTEGQMSWLGREIGEDYDIEPEMLAYVPQFGIFHEELTVEEILTDAAILRLGRLSDNQGRVLEVARMTDLGEFFQRKAKILSGGQKRRLALAMELVSEPRIILADEVTSGLDPRSSFEITGLLRQLATEQNKMVLHVTHELKHLHYYDAVVVLTGGVVAFQGPPSEMISYFQVEDPDAIFQRLTEFSSQDWGASWKEISRGSQPSKEELHMAPLNLTKQTGWTRWMAQFFCLTRRRFRIFVRNRAQIILQLLLLFIFPAIVVLFALKGLPEIQNMSLDLETNPANLLKESLAYSSQAAHVGSLVSGLAMFQVILLALMGANNAAREVASERGIFEKEKLSGLDTSSYLLSKIIFVGILVLAQSFWMTVLVKELCSLPGSFFQQFAVLCLVDFSLTSLSLAISSWAKTAEQASLLALYAVGFQLPLSGAVLALPDWLGTITRPFIAAYWAWSGYLETLKDTRLYDLIAFSRSTDLNVLTVCFTVLIMQIIAFGVLAYFGCYRSSLPD